MTDSLEEHLEPIIMYLNGISKDKILTKLNNQKTFSQEKVKKLRRTIKKI